MVNIHKITNFLAKFNIRMPETAWKEDVVRYMTETDSRIVEVPLLFNSIPMSKKRILDVGCRYSLFSIQLASLGHQVDGIDINSYHRKHPNFHFQQADILNNRYSNNYFDIVISLSTVEHIGLGRYNDQKNISGDIDAIREIRRVTKSGGQLLITLPFGKPIDSSWYRVYNRDRVKKLLTGYKINKEYVFQDIHGSWFPASVVKMERINSSVKPMAIVFVIATKS